MQGKRVDAVPGDGNQYPFPLLKAGEYGKDAEGVWRCVAPKETEDGFGFQGNLAKHSVTEHEDGTITVSPSILISRGDMSWHGYLERGVWREC
jgi:hypothetical protein